MFQLLDLTERKAPSDAVIEVIYGRSQGAANQVCVYAFTGSIPDGPELRRLVWAKLNCDRLDPAARWPSRISLWDPATRESTTLWAVS